MFNFKLQITLFVTSVKSKKSKEKGHMENGADHPNYLIGQLLMQRGLVEAVFHVVSSPYTKTICRSSAQI
jgi:hypothetical protein